ncbi:MAG: hypothetical protein JWR54_238 [Mucilaginibacter sp.]|nr:hypothetical protein [Mucilaginibacter sp.]
MRQIKIKIQLLEFNYLISETHRPYITNVCLSVILHRCSGEPFLLLREAGNCKLYIWGVRSF